MRRAFCGRAGWVGWEKLSHWRAVIVFNWKLRWRTFQYVDLDGFGIGVRGAASVLAWVARSSTLDQKVGGGDVTLLRDYGNTTPRWVVVNFLEREEQKEELVLIQPRIVSDRLLIDFEEGKLISQKFEASWSQSVKNRSCWRFVIISRKVSFRWACSGVHCICE